MTRVVMIGSVGIGEGKPKVIVPIVEVTEGAILESAIEASNSNCDLVEWRLDWYEEVCNVDAVVKLSHQIKQVCQKPLLITFRTIGEGGVRELTENQYVNLYREVLLRGEVDAIDLEFVLLRDAMQELVILARQLGIVVVLSSHDFNGTPSKDELIRRVLAMAKSGGDICKLAVMPHSVEDVLLLLETTREAKKKISCPLITMSMGRLGAITRVAGELVGSAASFAVLQKASAPGQLPVDQLQEMIAILSLDEEI